MQKISSTKDLLIPLKVDWNTKCIRCGSEEYSKLAQDKGCYECNEEIKKQEDSRKIFFSRAKMLFGENAVDKFSPKKFNQTIDNASIYEICKKFDFRKDNLFFCGSTGMGKSHLTKMIVIENMKNGIPAWFGSTFTFGLELRGNYGYDILDKMEKFKKIKIFAIDDLGKKSTEYELDRISDILEYRKDNDINGLIINSNLALDQLAKKCGDDRLTSRINGLCKIIEVYGEDYRKKESKERNRAETPKI